MTRCRCGHLDSYHDYIEDLCGGSVVCGCAEFRPDDGKRWPPARFREEWDPSPEPVDRQVR